jgi:hypothetical protein
MTHSEEVRHVLVRNGEAVASIVVPEAASPGEMEAARELQHYLKKITRAHVPFLTVTQVSSRFLILIGRANQQYGLTGLPCERESYVIRTGPGKLHIVGADDDGLYFAVCTFLEKYCDVHWFWPGELGEVVPELSVLSIPDIDISEAPDFHWRNRGPGGALWGPRDRISKQRELGVSEEHREQVRLWERRNKLGGMKVWGGHAWGDIVPPQKYGKEHPEYFALVDGRRDRDFVDFDGKHGAQLCTSNPDLPSIFAAYIDSFFRTHPEYDALHISPNDGGRFCQCEQCRALDTGKKLKNAPDKPVITDRIFGFANGIARETRWKHPEKYLVNLAYSWYVDPPARIRIDERVIPQYCLWSCYLHFNEEKKQEHYSRAKGWTEAAKNVAIYEYFINGAWPDLPRIVYERIAESLRYLHGIGIRLYQAQAGDGFAVNGLNYYIASKLWWDVGANVDALVDEFYEKAFGDAGHWVRSYHKKMQSAWQRGVGRGEHPSCSSFAASEVHRLYPLELLRQCEADLSKAVAAAADDRVRKRIDFLRKGLTYVILTIEAATLTKELETRGISISERTVTDEEEVVELERQRREISRKNRAILDLARRSLDAWETRDRYVESLKDDFVISYFWIKYNDANRTFNPTQRLRALVRGMN